MVSTPRSSAGTGRNPIGRLSAAAGLAICANSELNIEVNSPSDFFRMRYSSTVTCDCQADFQIFPKIVRITRWASKNLRLLR